jgi:hypothetical protein
MHNIDREMIDRAQKITRFRDMRLDFISFNNSNLGLFYKNENEIP